MHESLTSSSKDHDTPPPSPPSERSSPQFSFPTLASDGVASTYRQRTPPAALSSLAARMANILADSIGSLDNDASYDMVDDLSELSSDDHDTVSMTSTTNDDEQVFAEEPPLSQSLTVELGEDNVRVELEHSQDSVSTAEQAEILSTLLKSQAFKVRVPFPDELGLSSIQEPSRSMMDDSTDDLETPRQSRINFLASAYAFDSRSSAKNEQNYKKAVSGRETPWINYRGISPAALLLSILVALSMMYQLYVSLVLHHEPYTPIIPAYEAAREADLIKALQSFTGTTQNVAHINTTHLFPEVVALNNGTIFTRPTMGSREIRYQALLPNHLLVSLPQVKLGKFPVPVSWSARRGTEDIAVNQTELVAGIYAITIDEDDAHGPVSYSVACKNPVMSVSVTNDFGNRFLHRHTYQKAGTDLSKVIVKDITEDLAKARDVAKNVTKILQPDLEARVRNVSLMLRSAATDLVVFTDRAVDTARHAEENGVKMVQQINKDVKDMTRDVYLAFRDAAGNASAIAKDALKALKPLTKDAILVSRERALIISQQIFARSKHATKWKVKAVKDAGVTKRQSNTGIKKVKADAHAIVTKIQWPHEWPQAPCVTGEWSRTVCI